MITCTFLASPALLSPAPRPVTVSAGRSSSAASRAEVEKHFTLDKSLEGNDHYHAGDPEDFAKAIRNFELISEIVGDKKKTVLECEMIPRREARRSLVLTHDMKAGEVIAEKDLIAKRPGTGISPKYIDIVIGQSLKKDLKEDTVLSWENI